MSEKPAIDVRSHSPSRREAEEPVNQAVVCLLSAAVHHLTDEIPEAVLIAERTEMVETGFTVMRRACRYAA